MPQFLPDNRHFLFHVLAGRSGAALVYVGSLDSKSAKLIAGLEGNLSRLPCNLRSPGLSFVPSGWRFSRAGSRYRSAGTHSGEGIPLVEEVSAYSVSENRRLVYQQSMPGLAQGVANQLAWFDRKGMRIGNIGPPSNYAEYRALTRRTSSGCGCA